MKHQVPVPPWVGGDLPSIFAAEPSQEQTPKGGVAPSEEILYLPGRGWRAVDRNRKRVQQRREKADMEAIPPIEEREGGKKCGINN